MPATRTVDGEFEGDGGAFAPVVGSAPRAKPMAHEIAATMLRQRAHDIHKSGIRTGTIFSHTKEKVEAAECENVRRPTQTDRSLQAASTPSDWARVDILQRMGLSRTPLVFEHGERFGYQRRPDVDAA